MSSADPFHLARDEIAAALSSLNGRYRTTELDSVEKELESLAADVRDLSMTVQIVQRQPEKFPNISREELSERIQYISKTEQSLREIRLVVQNRREERARQAVLASAQRNAPRAAARGGLGDVAEGYEQTRTRELMTEQDEYLRDLANSSRRLNDHASAINQELMQQQETLRELDRDIDRETERMGVVLQGVGKLLQTGDGGQIKLVVWLSAIFLLLTFLNLNT